jgi:tetratricopeptide (TPR) repeat protein
MNSSPSSSPQSVQESVLPRDHILPLVPERVPLPAPPKAQTSLRRADWLLAALVVLLAFLVASTPARNSDLFLHLATGRAVADGSYRFHGDPFAQDANSWIAHSWLSDLLAFETFENLGGTVLVILKAMLVALLAALLIRLGGRERGMAWSAVAVALALLAMSGRLLLQPALLSAVLLGATLALLERGRRLRANNASWIAAYGWICLLFALWANLDDWFLLGPFTIGLYLIGSLTGRRDAGPPDLVGLVVLLGAGMLACLLTPFHVHGFTVPAELGLSATAQALEKDPVLQKLFDSPFNESYFHSGAAWSIPGLAYLALVVLSAISFAGSRDAWRDWRLPVWLGFLALSSWSVRAVPFFAVAAAPILARNAQDFVQRFRPAWMRRDEFFFARLGRGAALLLLMGLLVSAWPGWLQGAPYEMRRWVVLPDPSLRQAAEQLKQWRETGRLADEERGFHFSPEEANYFAYFCPGEKGIVDARLHVSPATAVEYVQVRRALLGERASRTDWQSILRARGINHLVVYDSNEKRIHRVCQRLARQDEEWVPTALTGRTAIFAWKDPQRPSAAAKLPRLSIREEAYHPSEAKKAPRDWPGRGPEPPAWWHAFVRGRPAGSPDSDQAALLLLEFELRSQQHQEQRYVAWDASRVAAAVAALGGPPVLAGTMQQALDLQCFRVDHSPTPVQVNPQKPDMDTLAVGLRNSYLLEQDDAPPEYLWLAIRAARRALHDNPDDARAYLILGEAYLRLLRNTRERFWKVTMPILKRLRQVQASAALNQALLLQPDLLPAHNSLSLLYQDMELWDLRLKHRREVFRLTQARGPAANETLKEWQDRVAQLQVEVTQLDQEIKQALEQFDVNTANYKIMDRVKVATNYGLGGKALDILLASDAASFGRSGVELELHLLLTTGRVREVRDWMSPDHRESLGDESYLQDRLELAAACGDYEEADARLAEWLDYYNRPETVFGITLSLPQTVALGIANEVLHQRLDGQTLSSLRLAIDRKGAFFQNVPRLLERLQRAANLTVLRGLLALERGDTEQARQWFDRAAQTYQSGKGLIFGGWPLAEHYHTLLSSSAR